MTVKFKKRLSSVLCIAAASSLLAACGSSGDSATEVEQGFVISNATIVDTRDGSLQQGRTIVVDGGKIQTITSERMRATGAAQEVDASGKYVVPGYIDMHTHVMEAIDLQPNFFPLMIANGVTAFRDQDLASQERGEQLNADSAAGLVDAPEAIFAGGEAHLNPAESTFDASNRGMPYIDHLGAGMGLLMDCSTQAQDIRTEFLAQGYRPSGINMANFILNPRAYDGNQNARFYQRVLDTYDENTCEALSQAFVHNGTWQIPSLIRLRTQDWGNDPLYRQDPNLIYVEGSRRANWNEVGDMFSALPAGAVTTLQNYYELQKRATLLMQRSGVKMLSGSDIGGIWLIAGFSLQQEFQELAAAGLSPLEVLQTTTLNPAEFLNRQASMGTVEEGKNADLVLLDANPLDSVDNLGKIDGVFLKGRYFSKADLEELKRGVADAYANQ
ncbi:amidohydrolase family protein [Pusillimonas noertemannii]|uniref:amidohydrolase family protein n=1 Tax=Pusillimonas noertemannii TaxID=305977 RepID=UPI0003017823|nr:amidohydrolase family protein [Pusillimonas noertemannii]